MRKFKLFFAFLLMAVLSIGQVWGATETLTLSENDWTNESVQSSVPATSATIALEKNSASTSPTYYTADGLRIYGVKKGATTGGTIAFTAKTDITIKEIAFTYTVKNSGVLSIKNGSGSYNTSTKKWSGTLTAGNAVSFVVTNPSDNNNNPQVKITEICIRYLAKVTFDANGGSCATANVTQADTASTVSLPTPTRDGFTCTGWYTTANGGTKRGDAGGSYKPAASETLYAHWESASCANKVTITAGTPESGASFSLSETGEQNCCEALTINVTGITAPSGKQFKQITQMGVESGVTIDNNAKTVTYAANSNGASTINVEFENIPTHNIIFNNGGVKSIANAVVAEGASYDITETIENSLIASCTYKKFEGWTRSSSIANENVKPTLVTSVEMEDEDINLYAVYSITTGGGSSDYTAHLTNTEMTGSLNSSSTAYDATSETSYEDSSDGITWSGKFLANTSGPYVQIRQNATPSYLKLSADGNISEVKVTVTSTSNKSGGQNNMTTGYNNFGSSINLYLSTANVAGNANANVVATAATNTTDSYQELTLTPSAANHDELYIISSGACRIWLVDVTYSQSSSTTTYSLDAGCAAPGQCVAPTFDPGQGTYDAAQSVELATTTDGADIYYTTDNSTPSSTNGTKYTSAISVTQNTTIKAIAIKDGMDPSEVATGEFKIRFATAPTFSPAEGDYTSAQSVTMTATGAEHIYYTMTSDGSTPADPTIESLEYTDAIPLNANGTYKFKAIAVKAGFAPSNVESATYTLDLPYATIADFVNSGTGSTVKRLQLTNAYILAVNGYSIYVQDASAKGIIIYNKDGYGSAEWVANLVAGNQITGIVRGTNSPYNGQLEMASAEFVGTPTIIVGTRPTPATIDAIDATAFTNNAMKLVKVSGVYYQSGNPSNKNYTFTADEDGLETGQIVYDQFEMIANHTMVDAQTQCDVIGIMSIYSKGTTLKYQLIPILVTDIEANADADAPVFTPAGGATEGEAVQVDLNSYVTIAAADANHSVDVAQAQITTTTAMSVTAVSSRDFYRSTSVTKWYYGNSASASYDINGQGSTTEGTIVAQVGGVNASSAAEGDEVHILITPNTHFELATIKVNGNDPDVVSAGTEYSFEMPAAAVTIAVTWNEDAKYAVTFEAGTGASGETPTMSGDEYYAGTHITLPDNTFTYDASHVFDGWLCSANSTKYAAGADYTMTAAATTFTAQWKEKSAYSTVYTSNVSELAGTTTYHVTITNDVPEDVDYNALKAGKGETVTFTIPTNTTALYAHIAAWNNESQTVTISGACFNEDKEQAVIYDSNVASTPTTYDINDTKAGLEVPDGYFFEIPLDKAVTEPTVISITAASNKRFVLFGVNAVYPAEITLDPTSHAFGEVKEGLTKSQEFTIAANAMCTGDLAAEIIGTDADKFEVSAIAANKVTVTFAPEVGEIGDFAAQLQVSCTNANVTANLTATGISATQPEISVDQTLVEFGSVPQGNPLASQAVSVTLSNISTGATASISGTAFSIDPENLAANGDITITPNTSLVPGNYSEKLTISATGATTKEVTVTMTIQDKWIVTYTSNVVLSTTGGTSASNATVVINENSYEAIKAGTGSAAGAVKIIVPAYTTKLHFHAAGWKGETVKVKADGAQEQSLTSDNALTGSGTTFALQSAPQYFSIDVTDNTQPTTIEIAASAGKRFVIYGVNVDTYKRDVKVGNYGTLCVKNGGVLNGATLFEIAGKEEGKIFFDEVEGNVMVAGKPYIFLPEETSGETTSITVTYNTTNKTTAGYGNGFYGTYVDLSSATGTELDGNYVISNNRYILVDDDRVTLPAHRAYIKLDEIGSPSAPSGARRRVAISGAPAVVTDIDALNADEAPRKVMIDGQLYIILGEKMFDATGRLVK